jgi:Pyruvate/2-oxoacid:ferredoxin oxidoreductase gamma subunit
VVTIDSVAAAIRVKFPGRVGDANAAAARAACEHVRSARPEAVVA